MPEASPEYTIGRLKSDKFPHGECVINIWRDGKRQRHRLGTGDEAAARRLAPTVYAEIMKPKGSSVAELWAAYCIDKKGNPSVEIMHHQWKALEPHFGRVPATSITYEDCRSYVAHRRAAGRKEATIVTELGRLRMVLRWAEKRALINRAPEIERPSLPADNRERHLTAPQVKRLAAACKTPHLELFVHLAYATAGRAGAILGLTWDRVHFDRNRIDLEDPGIKAAHKGRAIVPMTRSIRLRLLEVKRGARTAYVIEWAGKPVSSVKRGLRTAAADAELPHVHPHMLRHSAAVRQAEAGVRMEEIASYLGHANPSITRRIYARFSPEALSEGAAALELDDPIEPVQNVA